MAQPPASRLLALRLEIKSVQLSVAKSVTSPAAIVIFCNSPKFKSKRLTAECAYWSFGFPNRNYY